MTGTMSTLMTGTLMTRARTLVAGAMVTALALGAGAGTASAAGVAQGSVVSAVPGTETPQVLDNRVLDLAEVGNRIVVTGSFTQVRDIAANGGTTFSQPYVFAFDPTTGAVDPAFRPTLDGVVNSVVAGPGNTVYLGGSFGTVNGSPGRNLVQVSLATGQRTAFAPPAVNGAVNDLVLSGGRLFVAGVFSTVGTAPHGGLATLNPTTGALDEYMGVDVTLNHNWDGTTNTARAAVGVQKIDISPDGATLIAIGNFKQADGLPRDQVAMVSLPSTGAVVKPNWATHRYEPACYSWAFDTYMRDVQFAPDGSYFAIVDTGGANDGTLCDTTTRWETSDTGDDVQPRWTAYSGGDTSFSVEVTGAAIYIGGHMRWLNNSFGHDSPGPGAVPRPGIAALDPRTGIPLSWNPGRNPRGVGAQALLATSRGLYVGSDTQYIGNRQYLRPGLAYFPLAGGSAAPDEATGSVPANVYLGGHAPAATAPGGPVLYRVNAGGPELPAVDGGPVWSADDGTDNPLRDSGSSSAGWGPVATVDSTVPSSTPPEIFASERWDGSDAPELQWSFDVPVGTKVVVRLYFANRYDGTGSAGQRVFDVAIDGSTVLSNYDIAGDVGNQVGTMRAFPVTSDGTVNIDFGHVIENPLVDGIEIVQDNGTGGTPPPANLDSFSKRWFDPSAGTTTPDGDLPDGGVEWSKARGAFMAGSDLFYGYPDANGAYSLYRRTFDGTAFGPATALDPYDDPFWSSVQTGSGQTYQGVRPGFYNQLPSVTGMFFDAGRLYYTRAGHDQLYVRGFSVDSGVVGADELVAVGSGFSDIGGMLLAGGQLYGASRSTGNLLRFPFANGAPSGSATTVSGPSIDGRDWRSQALFIGPGGPPPSVNKHPVASFTPSCTNLNCSFDGTGSADPDGTVASYAWDFGDGATAAVAMPTHTFTTAGGHQVTLTVTDNQGATGTTTSTVTVTAPPPPVVVALRGATGVFGRDVRSLAVTVPASVQARDGIVLVLSTNSAATGRAPAGYTLRRTQTSATGITTQLFSHVAGAADHGTRLTVALTASAKATLQLLAYSGTSATDPVAAVTSRADIGGTGHTTPTATAAARSRVVSVWSDTSTRARRWTAPGTVAVRSSLAGVGTNDVATLVGDSGVPASGRVGGLRATVPTASTRATVFTIVLAAA